ncbi:hypothetical protein PRUB_a2472 [Pseudoalteromonas rubra]|uniref:Uncharacterized protein n=1 Tax=Pseudoalteromonas rubra TaxID=43658 RepID=A0A8T0CD59_9GAMM|nr:hypothetical protein PRUB_a2472 [Pseudoalteromonas rubra]
MSLGYSKGFVVRLLFHSGPKGTGLAVFFAYCKRVPEKTI